MFWPTGTFCFKKGAFWLGTFWVWDVLTVGRLDNGTFWLDTEMWSCWCDWLTGDVIRWSADLHGAVWCSAAITSWRPRHSWRQTRGLSISLSVCLSVCLSLCLSGHVCHEGNTIMSPYRSDAVSLCVYGVYNYNYWEWRHVMALLSWFIPSLSFYVTACVSDFVQWPTGWSQTWKNLETWNAEGILWTWKSHGIFREFCATLGKNYNK